jgi:exonuclease SbcC
VRLADAAGAQIEAANARAGEIESRILVVRVEAEGIASRLDAKVDEDYRAARLALEDLREQYAEAATKVARLEQQVKGIKDILADLAHKRSTLEEIEREIEAAQAELEDWRYLERACGRDGIQALELDAMGPSIAETANGLLDAAYGSRFRVEIRTTRLAGRGSKVKQVEDFEIVVHDTERGTEQPLDTLSGGETVWIRKALYDAFGIIRAKSTGTKFLTVCLDEADGALDPDARRRYVAMLQAAHVAAGRRHTIVISHSEEAQEAIGQVIRMGELAREGVRA